MDTIIMKQQVRSIQLCRHMCEYCPMFAFHVLQLTKRYINTKIEDRAIKGVGQAEHSLQAQYTYMCQIQKYNIKIRAICKTGAQIPGDLIL
jgi:hypothetical protein